MLRREETNQVRKEMVGPCDDHGDDPDLQSYRTRIHNDGCFAYDKGAYVMHMLREEMGERAFWSGLRLFTRRYFGKSVVTTDFIAAMEEAHGKSLKEFFAKWVYLKS